MYQLLVALHMQLLPNEEVTSVDALLSHEIANLRAVVSDA